MFGAASTGVSQFHVADAASGASSEIIAVTNVSGTTWTVTRGAESTTPVAHASGFTVYQVVTAGWYSAVDVPASRTIQSFGAQVDGRELSGISVSGTALTASASQFLPGDVGRTVVVYTTNREGPAGQAVVSEYHSATSLTLATSITTTSSTTGAIGTDDTTAWQAAIAWAFTSPGGGRVTYSGNGISLIAGPQVTGTVNATNGSGATYTYTGQLLLPAVAQAAHRYPCSRSPGMSRRPSSPTPARPPSPSRAA